MSTVFKRIINYDRAGMLLVHLGHGVFVVVSLRKRTRLEQVNRFNFRLLNIFHNFTAYVLNDGGCG